MVNTKKRGRDDKRLREKKMLTAVLYERIEISGGQKKKRNKKSPSDNGLHYRHFNEVKKKKEGESSPEFKKKIIL